MGIIKVACLFIILACAGCGPEKYWCNEENTFLRAKSDCRECLYQAQVEALDTAMQEGKDYGTSPNIHETYLQTLFEKCMKDKGYKETWDYSLDYYIRKGFVEHNDKQYNIAGK